MKEEYYEKVLSDNKENVWVWKGPKVCTTGKLSKFKSPNPIVYSKL